MLVVHGAWVGGRLAVWGEQLPGGPSAPPAHPFAARTSALAEAVGTHGATGDLELLLPTVEGAPVPSPEAGADDVTAGAHLAPWRAPALFVDPGAALAALAALGDDADWLPGESLRYLATVAAYARGMVRRGRMLPQLVTADGGWAARWRPVLTGRDAAAFRELATAMPPVCRAAAAERHGVEVLRDALDALVDAAARLEMPERLLLGHRPGAKAPLADRWALALTAADATVVGARGEADDLRAALDGWFAAAHEANGPVRVCFRLVEPPLMDDTWLLEFGIQSTEDPGLYVPAPVVWSGRRLPGMPDRPDETLLAGLGRAVRLFVPVRDALDEARPSAVPLQTAEAHDFLREAAPLLQSAGYGVQLPAWAGRKNIGTRLTTRSRASSGPKGLAAQGFGLEELVDYRLDLMVGDEAVSAADLEELARLKVPLLRIRGRWVELDDRQLQAAIRAVERHQEGQLTVAEVLAEVARGGDEDLPLVDVDADGWLGDLLSGASEQRLEPTATPSAFRGTLRPYQERGLSWLDFLSRLGLGGVLADDMGLGKCLGADTPVFINGTLAEAERIWEEHAGVLTPDGEGEWAIPTQPLATAAIDSDGTMVSARISRLYRQRIAEKVRRVRLDDGSEILITRRHRLLGLGGWTRDVAVGDRICVPTQLPWRGEALDSDLVVLLAWQISRGHEARNGALRISRRDRAVLDRLVRRIAGLGSSHGLRVNRPGVRVTRTGYELLVCSVDYVRFLAGHGYRWGRPSAHKRIPDLVMAADDASVRLFLREFFTAEGSVSIGSGVVEIASGSPWLMAQLTTLLRRLGIWLRVEEEHTAATNGSGIGRPYRTGHIGGASLRRFRDLVGFSDPAKQAKLDSVCARPANGDVVGVPASDPLPAAHASARLRQRHLGGNQEVSRAVASTVVDAMDHLVCGEAGAACRARPRTTWGAQVCSSHAGPDTVGLRGIGTRPVRRATREAFYAKVVAVEEVDYAGYVYDFEVAEHHNFVAGGMLCHNTAQTLSLLLAERERGEPAATLLVCPMSLVSNWQKEAERFAPSLRLYVHHGASRARDDELADAVTGADLVITTYGTALRDLAALRELGWGRVVCDEAQAIKNSAARQAQAVRAIPAGTRLALTGTPVENHLAELWSIMDFCNPGLLGPAKTFRRRYQEPIEVRQDEDAAVALKRATGPFVLRRLKTDKTIISDLPDKLEMKVWCPLTPEQATLYQAVVEDMFARIEGSEGIERRGNVLATMTRLKQVCNHPAHLLRDGSRLSGRSGKLARLQELTEEIVAEGDKALVFTQYAEFGALLKPYLAAHLDRPVLWLHGGLPKARRDELVERFQTDDEPMIFLLSLKAAGTGLNLTAANHVIHVDRWWNPAVEDQATDRAFRIGQSRNVQVRTFVCTGTLEERIDEMIEQKKALAQRVVGTGEDWITELSTSELRELFSLDPKAVR